MTDALPAPGKTEDSIHDRLGALESPLSSLDPVSFARALLEASGAALTNPVGVWSAGLRWTIGEFAAIHATAKRMIDTKADGPVAPAKGDKRFDDPAYATNPLYFWLCQQYLLGRHLTVELLDAAQFKAGKRFQGSVWRRLPPGRSAPTNTLLGNPRAIREAFNTGGLSLIRGRET